MSEQVKDNIEEAFFYVSNHPTKFVVKDTGALLQAVATLATKNHFKNGRRIGGNPEFAKGLGKAELDREIKEILIRNPELQRVSLGDLVERHQGKIEPVTPEQDGVLKRMSFEW